MSERAHGCDSRQSWCLVCWWFPHVFLKKWLQQRECNIHVSVDPGQFCRPGCLGCPEMMRCCFILRAHLITTARSQ